MPTSYLFILGRTPELGFAELRSFFPDAQLVNPDIARITMEKEFSAVATITKLGGTVKIARELGTISAVTAVELRNFLPTRSQEIHFGVSMYGSVLPGSLLTEMKKLLEQKGMRARYASVRHGETLSSVTVDKQHITELIVVKTTQGYVVGVTLALQPYEAWGKRDYGRPHADPKSGMLPPKVARMLVNIAGKGGRLLDPFCGMGTILAEASLVGWTVYGSDLDAGTVTKAKANLDWLKTQATVFSSDATHVSEHILERSIDAIVTEPYMGATSIANDTQADVVHIKNIIKGLEKLYIGCLRDWAKILVAGGVVVIALPEYAIGARVYFVKKVIDMCKSLGYTTLVGPIAYGRPYATVKRNFYIFQYGTR